ncbi:hypothetical protein STIAU_5457 [Stigmatella aurantiaca DW4/3-1]|uniref:Uncharacterized protein n=1 Tax=Stigmatella aurantiaca (strain DW4/3-1) TaxID=378806 RepID=Q08WP6_STIAD|nr:hypothetical protein STIAU_5457 [Stigmatella aurantiaca DW4/3-1]
MGQVRAHGPLHAEAQPPHHGEGLEEDLPAHLRVADPPILENDGHLLDGEALLEGAVGEFDLERVAGALHLAELDGLQHPAVKALEAARQIVGVHPENGARVERAAAADELPANAPVHRAPPRDVARAQHQVCSPLGRIENRREVPRIVAEVRVHLDDVGVARIERPAEGGQIGAAKPLLLLPVKHPDARLLGRQRVGDLPGAIRRVVIDDEDVHPGLGLEHRTGDGLDVLRFVVGGDADQRSVHGAAGHSRAGVPSPSNFDRGRQQLQHRLRSPDGGARSSQPAPNLFQSLNHLITRCAWDPHPADLGGDALGLHVPLEQLGHEPAAREQVHQGHMGHLQHQPANPVGEKRHAVDHHQGALHQPGFQHGRARGDDGRVAGPDHLGRPALHEGGGQAAALEA